jgi:hypothetical protein
VSGNDCIRGKSVLHHAHDRHRDPPAEKDIELVDEKKGCAAPFLPPA